MRALLHLTSVVLMLPGVALAGMFLILGHAIATQSLIGFLGELLAAALWLIPWGLLAACSALLLLILGGLSPRYRWIAGVCVALLAVASTAVVLVLSASHTNLSAGQLLFFVPGLVAAAAGIWLAWTEFPRARRSLLAN